VKLPDLDYGKIFRWTTTGLAIVLAIPVTLILVTWNSLPGDKLYATKRSLETVPRIAFANNHLLAAKYETKITDRRFIEATTLIKKNNVAGFNDLRKSIKDTAQKIKDAKDPAAKKAYIAQLESYQATLDNEKQTLLAAASNNSPTTNIVVAPTNPTNPTSPTTSTNPSVITNPTNPTTPANPSNPTTPTTPTNPTTPVVTPPPPPPPDPNDPVDNIDQTQDEIDNVIEDLEKQDLDDLDQLEQGINEVEK
jgi:hypothetical protein